MAGGEPFRAKLGPGLLKIVYDDKYRGILLRRQAVVVGVGG